MDRILKLAVVLLVAVLVVGASPRLKSPREQSQTGDAPMRRIAAAALAPAAELIVLSWSYPLSLPRAGVIFDVEHRTDLRSGSWVKVGETLAPPFSYPVTGNKAGFFRVISRSTQVVSLTWDASPSTNLMGYFIYRGSSSHNYTNNTFAGNTTIATISDVVARTFFAATARDGQGRESIPSNEVDYTPGPVYPVTGLKITKL